MDTPRRVTVYLQPEIVMMLEDQREAAEKDLGVPLSISAYISKLIRDHAQDD